MANLLNGKDLALIFGTHIQRNGSDPFLAFPKRKESLSHNYPEETGIDIDLGAPQFEAREFSLKCALIADNRTDYWIKYSGLFTELSQAGTHTLYLADLDKAFLLYYKAQQGVSKLVRFGSSGKVGVIFELVFGEADPRSNIDIIYLGEDPDTFLIV
jgi:hypothetical protein